MNNKTEQYCLCLFALVLSAAFALRYKGIMFGYPLPVHPDEPRLVETALGMVRSGDLNPHFFNYPSLNIYLQALLYLLLGAGARLFTDYASLADIPIIDFYVWGRLLIVVMSTATIYFTYEIGRRLVHPVVGLIAACFLGASYLHVMHSFTVTVDASVGFWATLATLMAVQIYTRAPKMRYYILGGVFAGLATSSKYTAFGAVLPLILAHFYDASSTRVSINRKLVLGMLAVPLAFVLTTPYAVIDYPTFSEAIEFEARHYREGHAGHESTTATSFHLYARYLAREGYGWLPTALAAGGMLGLLSKDWRKALLLASFPLLLFLFVGQYKTWFARNMVAITPFLALFSALCVFGMMRWLQKRLAPIAPKWSMVLGYGFAALLTIVSVGGQAFKSYDSVRALTLPDTRWIALQWIEQNLPAGARIGREHYTPPVEKFSERYQVQYLGYGAVPRRSAEVEQMDYMIVSSADYARYLDRPDVYPREAQAYASFFAQHELVREFAPDGETRGGPVIRIYKMMSSEMEDNAWRLATVGRSGAAQDVTGRRASRSGA